MNASPAPYPILVIHGPNLNMLGLREPDIYGRTTLADINRQLQVSGPQWGMSVETFQSNLEGAIVDKIQSAAGLIKGLIINPAGYTHTSVCIRDALLMIDAPIIEVHLSNVYRREPFRHHSYIADIAAGRIIGLGAQGYFLALQALASVLGVAVTSRP